MTVYNPDRWVVVEFASKDTEPIQKVFAGWYGGYLSGDSWKLNSGITKVVQNGDLREFHGESGSIYSCHKDGYGMSGYMGSVYSSWEKMCAESTNGATVRIVEGYND